MARQMNMVMLGPSRVGKTSLLATMCREIDKIDDSISISPDPDTRSRLDEAYWKLSEVNNQSVWCAIINFLEGNQGFIQHKFEVKYQRQKEFDLVFHDFRGGAVKESGSEQDKLAEIIGKSRVIFNVIDATALMELNEAKNDKINYPYGIKQLLENSLKANEKYVLIFALTKCESYINTNKQEQLIKRFEDRYSTIINLIKQLNGKGDYVAGIVMPVQTMGNVEFKEIQNDNFIFVRNHNEFKPIDVDQPLRYALAFAMKHVNENKWIYENLFDYFTGRNQAFQKAYVGFCSKRDTSGKFKLYGSEQLLRD